MAGALSFEVAIVGGGFAGVYCAQTLARALGDEARQKVAIISDQNSMVFQPMLAEVAGSALSPRHVVNPLRRLCRGVSVLRGRVHSVDLAARRLQIDGGGFSEDVTLSFEHLVLAVGGVVDLSRVPGMTEHALLMKNVGDAMKLRAAVIDRFEEANLKPDDCEPLLSFVVVGGGYSGVETAGQLLDMAKEMLPVYPRLAPEKLRVTLIHSGSFLLPEISESLGRYCEENLRARGLEIILGGRVSAITSTRVHLTDGRSLDANTVVCTIGNAPHPLLRTLCSAHSIDCAKGRVVTEPTLRVIGHENLWAAGDCAAVPMHTWDGDEEEQRDKAKSPVDEAQAKASPFTPRPYCPPTAQFAYRQGELLGKNLARVLQGRLPLEPFTFTGLGELALIGHHAAVAEVFGMKFSGFIAWWMWRTVYLSKLPGLERKLRVMMEWTLDLFFPRDISLLQPSPTELLEDIHLEPGDMLFQQGEPARSVYLVQSGRIEVGSDGLSVSAGGRIGEQCQSSEGKWQQSAKAIESSTVISVDKQIVQLLSKN